MTKVKVENPDLWLEDLLEPSLDSDRDLNSDLMDYQSITELFNHSNIRSNSESPSEPINQPMVQNNDRLINNLIGRYIDQKYLVEALVCKQQLSSVYQVSCGDRNLIVKILHLDCTDNQELKERFLWQMQAIACIQTQKVVRVLDYGTDFLPLNLESELLSDQEINPDSQSHSNNSVYELPYIVTENCSYPTLTDKLEAESGAIIRPVRLWHQNLKPSNIFLGDLFIQLSDFGGYQLLFLPEQYDWRYAAPEDWQQNHLPRDERRDVYGCGLILYELLNGKSAYQLPFSSTAEQWQTAITCDPVPNFSLDLAIPRSLELVVLRCLEKDPQHRFANLKQLQLELEQIAQIRKTTKPKSKRSLFQPFYLGALGAIATAGTFVYIGSQPQKEIQSKTEPDINWAIQPKAKAESIITAKSSAEISAETPKKITQESLVKVKPKNSPTNKSATKSIPIKAEFKPKTNSLPGSLPSFISPSLISKQESKLKTIVKPDQNPVIQPPVTVQADNPKPIRSVIPTVKSFPIPVAKRLEQIPPPGASFFPKPLPKPDTKLIPPPDIVTPNQQDQAISKQIQLSIPVSDQNVANFDRLMQSSAELASQSINRDFSLYPQRQELQVAILGDRNGQEVPLLLAKVSRSQWQTNSNISKWANFIIKSESLLAAIPAPKSNLRR